MQAPMPSVEVCAAEPASPHEAARTSQNAAPRRRGRTLDAFYPSDSSFEIIVVGIILAFSLPTLIPQLGPVLTAIEQSFAR
jgi:hypothetical protein